MLIISKHHDYYDTAMGSGIDKACVYKRHQETHEAITATNFMAREINNSLVYRRLLGFCGKIYPILEIRIKPEYFEDIRRTHFLYNPEEAFEFLKYYKLLPKQKRYFAGNTINSKHGLRNFFEPSQYKYLENYFFKYRTPVFCVKSSQEGYLKVEVVVNHSLKDIGFQRIFDPFSAFQEIYQYISGVLGKTGKETIKISDKVKIQQHGFNKFSFRSEKGDKKPRKNNRGKRK